MIRIPLLLILALALAACAPIAPAPLPASAEPTAPAAETPPPAVDAPEPEPFEPQGFIRTIHDPVIAKEGDTYTVFSTGSRLIMIQSPDMVNWEWAGRVFEKNPAWTWEITNMAPALWAPDISYVNGEWRLYYAISTFGTQVSGIGLATNQTLDLSSPDYAWIDQGEVIRSQVGDPYNTIDANFVLDQEGSGWLAFGSFWDGLFMRRVDLATGKLDAADTTLYHLANRNPGPDNTSAIEAPFITYRAPYYYLFASFDQCCQQLDSTYNLRVGRSESVTGPYVDRDGVPMLEGGGTLIAERKGRWAGPGHNGILIEEGVYWIVYHAYDGQGGGISKLRIEPLRWSDDGWPSLPSQADQ